MTLAHQATEWSRALNVVSLVPDGAGSFPAWAVTVIDSSFLEAHSVVERWERSTLVKQRLALVEADEMGRTLENRSTGSPILQFLLYPILCVSKFTILENIYLKSLNTK